MGLLATQNSKLTACKKELLDRGLLADREDIPFLPRGPRAEHVGGGHYASLEGMTGHGSGLASGSTESPDRDPAPRDATIPWGQQTSPQSRAR